MSEEKALYLNLSRTTNSAAGLSIEEQRELLDELGQLRNDLVAAQETIAERDKRIAKLRQALEAIDDVQCGNPYKAFAFLREREVELPFPLGNADEYVWRGDYDEDARYVYPARQKIIDLVITDALAKEGK